MKKYVNKIVFALPFAAYAALALITSTLLLKYSSDIFMLISPLFSLSADTLAYVYDILLQLKTSLIVPPWAMALIISLAVGFVLSYIIKTKKAKTCTLIAMILLFIPCVLICILFMQINTIRISHLISVALPILNNLL